jgi:hypothetical protein
MPLEVADLGPGEVEHGGAALGCEGVFPGPLEEIEQGHELFLLLESEG